MGPTGVRTRRMKPNFALTLSFDGIGLLHRAFPGWHDVGEVALDTADLDAALAALRDKGLALTKGPMLSKLVIPDEQIKYLTFDGQGASDEALLQAVRDHLDGATPYALDDLAYDWSLEAGQVHVAAVARETLDEAETFADTHGFNPVSFVARPATGQFVGEPWFGEATRIAHQLTDGDSIERDTTPVRIVGPAPTPDAQASAPEPPEDPAPKASETDLAPDTPGDLTAQADVSDNDNGSAEDGAPMVQPDTVADQASTGPDTRATERTTAAPETRADAPAAAFRSIRARRDDEPAVSTPRLDGVARTAPAKAATTPAAPVTGQPKGAMSDAEVAGLAASLTASLDADDRAPASDTPAPDAAQSSAVSSFFTRRDAKPSASATAAPEAPQPEAPQDEKQRMTVFGARDTAAVRGKPRFLGLVLTGLLLLFLLAVAAWASVFMDDGIARLFRGDESREIAATPDFDTPQKDAAPAPAEQTDPSRDAAPAVSAPTQSPVAELTADEARARYAATGIWQIAPEAPTTPGRVTLDDFYQTSIDPQVQPVDAVALPDIAKTVPDTRPDTPGRPPAAGTRFRVDDRGLVIATTDGALTPQGVRVYAGRPDLTPPQWPDRPEAVVSALPTQEVLRLMEVRPKVRPDNLIEQNERGLLGAGGRTRTELASLRPRLRPESAQEAAMAAAQAASAAAAATPDPDAVTAALAEAVQTPDAFATATAQAVRASLKPNPRPRNFERVVARATQAARSAPVSPTQKVAPSAPTVTTVARAATDKNQISLRQVNLIGVYGTPSDRRALVRLANGRYKKVKVGDRLDGGQVAAIGDSELRYQKRGRNIVLQMPRG